jgi:hypothetical protein
MPWLDEAAPGEVANGGENDCHGCSDEAAAPRVLLGARWSGKEGNGDCTGMEVAESAD